MKINNICSNSKIFEERKKTLLSCDVEKIIKELEKDLVSVYVEIGDNLGFIVLNNLLSSVFFNENELYFYLLGVWNGQILGIK